MLCLELLCLELLCIVALTGCGRPQHWATALEHPPATAASLTSDRRRSAARRARALPEADEAPPPVERAQLGRRHEPQMTPSHVTNAVSKSLGTKLYGAHHLRRQAAIAAWREEHLKAANDKANELDRKQEELVKRSEELREEVATLQADGNAAAVRLGSRAQRMGTELGGVHAMGSGLEHLLQSQSAKLEGASSATRDVGLSRPQALTPHALITLKEADLACDDATLPAQVRMAGSAEEWSVHLAMQNMVDVTAGAEEEPRLAQRHERREDWIEAAKLELAQLKEQLTEERRKGYPNVDYEACAHLRSQIAALKRRVAEQRKRTKALDRLEADEELTDAASWRRPQRRLVALLDGTFGLPVEDDAMVSALGPFGQVEMVSNPLNDRKVAVRSGSSAQHLLFGETHSTRWDLMKSLVHGLVEEALETAPVRRPPSAVAPALWEWRDHAGRQAWHQFDSALSMQLEERYTRLCDAETARGVTQQLKAAPLTEPEHAPEPEPESTVIRWSEPADSGGKATFNIDLARMLLYPERNLFDPSDAGLKALEDAAEASALLTSAEIVTGIVVAQPIGTDHSTRVARELHPHIRGFAREIRRRDPPANGGSAGGTEVKGKDASEEEEEVSPAASPVVSPIQPRRSADVIEDAAVRAAMQEAEKLGRRDRALPIGTRLWVQDYGYGWYEGHQRNPKYVGAPRRGPATHRVRFEPQPDDKSGSSADGVTNKSMAGRAHNLQLVGPEAAKWQVMPPVVAVVGDGGGGGGSRGNIRRAQTALPRQWHSRKSVMGLPYTRYEFTRFQSRQEQVGTREVQSEPRFWMDTTAYDPVEDLAGIGITGGDGGEGDGDGGLKES